MKPIYLFAFFTSVIGSDRAIAQQTAKSTSLTSGEYHVTQSWSQQANLKRPYLVRVPTEPSTSSEKLPVLIFLHGNGGNARNAMNGFVRGHARLASRFITIFPEGYLRSWNIVSERSKADDLNFIETIVREISGFSNVRSDDFTIMGSSNGAALTNQIAIESDLPNIRNYITGVSPLNVWQYDGRAFKAKGQDNAYRKVRKPAPNKMLLNISGTRDRLVPYGGGPSPAIPAKGGKLEFIAAETSTFLWAREMGYRGRQLERPTSRVENVEIFEYLNGDVIHCKVVNAGHGAIHEIREEILLDFLNKR